MCACALKKNTREHPESMRQTHGIEKPGRMTVGLIFAGTWIAKKSVTYRHSIRARRFDLSLEILQQRRSISWWKRSRLPPALVLASVTRKAMTSCLSSSPLEVRLAATSISGSRFFIACRQTRLRQTNSKWLGSHWVEDGLPIPFSMIFMMDTLRGVPSSSRRPPEPQEPMASAVQDPMERTILFVPPPELNKATVVALWQHRHCRKERSAHRSDATDVAGPEMVHITRKVYQQILWDTVWNRNTNGILTGKFRAVTALMTIQHRGSEMMSWRSNGIK